LLSVNLVNLHIEKTLSVDFGGVRARNPLCNMTLSAFFAKTKNSRPKAAAFGFRSFEINVKNVGLV